MKGGGKGRGKGGGSPQVGVGTKVYVGNLSWETSWQDLKDHFRSVGEVCEPPAPRLCSDV